MSEIQKFTFGELESQLSGELIEWISRYATVMYFRDANSGELKVCGSGTLIKSNGKHFILTAAHVLDQVERHEKIGLALDNSAPQFYMETTYLGIHKLCGKPYSEFGPDLGLMFIPDNLCGPIEARKSFYNVDHYASDVLNGERDNDYGAWVAMGFPEVKVKHLTAPGLKTLSCFGQLSLCKIESVTTHQSSDLMRMHLAGIEHDKGLVSYEGISGGGLWQVLVTKDESSLKLHKLLLKGVLFYQLDDLGDDRPIVAHGPQSTYRFIQERSAA